MWRLAQPRDQESELNFGTLRVRTLLTELLLLTSAISISSLCVIAVSLCSFCLVAIGVAFSVGLRIADNGWTSVNTFSARCVILISQTLLIFLVQFISGVKLVRLIALNDLKCTLLTFRVLVSFRGLSKTRALDLVPLTSTAPDHDQVKSTRLATGTVVDSRLCVRSFLDALRHRDASCAAVLFVGKAQRANKKLQSRPLQTNWVSIMVPGSSDNQE